MPESDAPKTVKTAQTVFDIIELLNRMNGGRVTEIAEEANLAKSTVHRHLTTLAQRGYVAKDGDCYRVGSKFIELGEHVKNREEAYRLAKNLVRKLADQTGERAQFIIEEHGHAVYIHQSTGTQAVKTDSGEGKWGPLHASAAGKAILAEMPAEHAREIVDRMGLPAFTDNTITDLETLETELAEIRECNYSYNDQEYIKGLRAVGVPVLKTSGEVIGAFSVSGPNHRLKGDAYEQTIPNLLLGTANELELNIAYQ